MRLLSGSVGFALDPFNLQRREETIHRSVIPNISGPVHRTCRRMISHQPVARLIGVLAALVGMMQQLFQSSLVPDRHDQEIYDNLGHHLLTNRPDHSGRTDR